MRSYRVYENVNPEADISGEDFEQVSQINESEKLSRIFEFVKNDIAGYNLKNCRKINFKHEYDNDLVIKNYYDLVIIIKNLLTSGIESGASEITVLTEIKAESLIITVSDNGHGFTKDEQAYMFVPNFSVKEKKRDKSAGVKLYNVRKAIINGKGKLTINSTPGQGTTYTVRFPLKVIVAE